MRTRQNPPDALLRLAAAQAGVVSRSQALATGLTTKAVYRLLKDGSWGPLERGIFLVPHTGPSWLGRVWAGVLLGGSESRAAGSTAASLHGLDDEQRLPIEILVPSGTTPPQRDWLRFRQEREQVRASSGSAAPPRTRIADTVLDLCSEASADACLHWVTTAVQRRLVTPESLRLTMDRRTRMPNRKLLTGLLTDVGTGVHSTLEYRYLHDVERPHGLAAAGRQRTRPGRSRYVDVVYEEFGLVVELDGRVGHTGEGRFRDMERDNSHTTVGLHTLRYGWYDVTEQPCAVAFEVAEVLVGLGWTGYPLRCPQCR
ncbi:very-short-patch-repair endonuclease [Nakamurella sp. UYEF19]|uniref:type IV toxin-antitoxin system AbiEi family antitoxin domain-containing protein n=1 Tax=Nakamurella sp. UYEF19 TaxID=1756392 RepID=UPI003399BACC